MKQAGSITWEWLFNETVVADCTFCCVRLLWQSHLLFSFEVVPEKRKDSSWLVDITCHVALIPTYRAPKYFTLHTRKCARVSNIANMFEKDSRVRVIWQHASWPFYTRNTKLAPHHNGRLFMIHNGHRIATPAHLASKIAPRHNGKPRCYPKSPAPHR